jgi:DNA-binding PadR family transcriptional regulator
VSDAESAPIPTAGPEVVDPQSLSLFQQNILLVLARTGPQHGLGIKADLETLYGTDINHGRLYPNLDELVERGLLEKSQRDLRTNEYALTPTAHKTIQADASRRAAIADYLGGEGA